MFDDQHHDQFIDTNILPFIYRCTIIGEYNSDLSSKIKYFIAVFVFLKSYKLRGVCH